MDTVDKATRSRIMAAVKQRGTKPEVALRHALHHQGLRYRLNEKRLPGSPDLVFPRYRAVVFVHGCFWHSHGCKFSTVPSTRQDFWLAKFLANKERDRRKIEALLAEGWRVLVVWECSMKADRHSLDGVTHDVIEWIHSDIQFHDIGIEKSNRPATDSITRSDSWG